MEHIDRMSEHIAAVGVKLSQCGTEMVMNRSPFENALFDSLLFPALEVFHL